MQKVRFAIFYLDRYADDAYKKNWAIKVVTAVASSGSIAGWAVCQKLEHLWAVVIAVSQVINTIKDSLPYNTRLKNIEQAQLPLKLLYNKIELNWLSVDSGELTEKQINELLHEFQKEYIEIESQSFKGDINLNNKKLVQMANKQTDDYFNAAYFHRRSEQPATEH